MGKEEVKFMKKDIKYKDVFPQSPYDKELKGFVGKAVEVKDVVGNTIRGKCVGIKTSHLNIIVDTGEDIVICKNIQTIRRNKKGK